MNHSCCDSRECVIVSKFDFSDGDGVVLIDDGDCTIFKEFGEGILGINVLCLLMFC
jgi:hypothetical protein